MDPSKVQAILDWPEPKSLTVLRGFLGLTGYYRKFVRHYATIAGRLTDLLKKGSFHWTDEAAKAFAQLKATITTTPVLGLPNFEVLFQIDTDASVIAVGAVLSQSSHPLAFFSKKMSPKMQQSTSAYVREMYAITEAVKKWRQYFLGHKFSIYTDQQSLRNLLHQTIPTPGQQKWLTKLLGFDYEIHYKPGLTNKLADALSRKLESSEALLFAISSHILDLVSQLKRFYKHHTARQALLAKWHEDAEFRAKFKSCDYLLYLGERLFIPSESDLQTTILTELHSSPLGVTRDSEPLWLELLPPIFGLLCRKW